MTTRRWPIVVVALLFGAMPAHALEGLQPGMKAPALALEGLDGKRLGFGDFPSARAHLIVFWAGWSAKSPEVLERAEKMWRAHRDKGLVVIGVNVESPGLTEHEVSAVRGQVARLGLSFPAGLDRGLTAFSAYGVVAVPTTVLVTADGTISAALSSYPIAGREEFFDQVEAAVGVRTTVRPARPLGREPDPRAVRYFNLGRALMARGLADQAALELRRAIELDASFSLPRILLGQLHREQAMLRVGIQYEGRTISTVQVSNQERDRLLRDAQAQLDEAVKIDPASPAALTELALVHRARGDRAGARALLERALAQNSDYPLARSEHGALLVEAGERERGAAELAAAIQSNPVDWRLHATAAEAYRSLGREQAAAEAYRKGVELLWQSRRAPAREASPR